jgi:endoglucanase
MNFASLAAVTLALSSCIPRAKPGVANGGAPGSQPNVGPPTPAVRVNQVGYLPRFPKRATVRSDSEGPLAWDLKGADGTVVAKGTTKPFGDDAAAGEHLHVIDFSSVVAPGSGYVIVVGSDKSAPFDIGDAVYKDLKVDALRFFYYARSGVAISMPFAREERWTHAAGHPGDRSVPCAADAGCKYSLDVTGGWYDAGDYGKYVVNGGIAVWTLLDQYERARAFGATNGVVADGALGIPESGNGVPDILDEARFEVEFLLRMQVPDGEPNAGMAHHKIHDVKWSPLGQPPNESTLPRFLRPPSTAATLNLAAVAAQAARIWSTIDNSFAVRCLGAAEKAWTAAQANPATYAPGSDKEGGGPYDDGNVKDEFYWAAAELYATTGKRVYEDFVKGSSFFGKFPTTPMTWQDTSALGSISLAVAPSSLDRGRVAEIRKQIVVAADGFLALADKSGHRVPLAGGPYPWGSNSLVLDNAVVLALAHDFTRDAKYVAGVVDALDYILGRNPLAKSYVSGYGENPLEHPHHRFFAAQVDPKFPSPPPGFVSGGPNSGLQDPQVQSAGLQGCAPQKCYLDHVQAYSANEVAINWNAPLAWTVAYVDEVASGSRASPPSK